MKNKRLVISLVLLMLVIGSLSAFAMSFDSTISWGNSLTVGNFDVNTGNDVVVNLQYNGNAYMEVILQKRTLWWFDSVETKVVNTNTWSDVLGWLTLSKTLTFDNLAQGEYRVLFGTPYQEGSYDISGTITVN